MKPELHTERLKLRLIDASDLGAIHALHVLPETDEYNTLGIPEDIAETRSTITPWILDNQQEVIQQYTFAIEQKADKQFIGLIALKLGNSKYSRGEVWYKLDVTCWNRGFGTEALRRMLNFGFDTLKLHRIEAGCAVDNIGSIKVLEKVGMTREGRKRKVLPLKSGWSDNFEYAILETDSRG
ncbi:N-acetyltransferase [Pontibacter diazotrophicus]|uniref:N-acetyltransferase n=1 Tax=Pontibacter diazotrophicus TaxID=1400979 RepID=A0A3D8LB76_9BACT|nr:GNAT family protein [Pontibacter diazotrophicus]RDV14593.1 N-acetyltransferase [Pontibacter diazotrophicus]